MIGAMRHLLTLQEEVLSPADGGGFTRHWQDLVTTPAVYAEITALGGDTRTDLRQSTATGTYRLRIYHRRDVTAGMRLVGSAETYYIRHVADPDGTERYLHLTAETRGI
ncbi:MAG TPA: phage head closure protein [Alphaproteobacteria bacterium]|jgi:SPP1 family predicted phage head-tail adaptor|nr:phage head closure protein [Alphaproteobacteria bacterium]